MKAKFFKIQNKITGLYSSGGSFVTWNSKGKSWNRRGHAVNHMVSVLGLNRANEVYNDAILVEFEYDFNPVEVRTTPVSAVIYEKEEKKKKQKQSEKDRAAKAEYDAAKIFINRYELEQSVRKARFL